MNTRVNKNNNSIFFLSSKFTSDHFRFHLLAIIQRSNKTISIINNFINCFIQKTHQKVIFHKLFLQFSRTEMSYGSTCKGCKLCCRLKFQFRPYICWRFLSPLVCLCWTKAFRRSQLRSSCHLRPKLQLHGRSTKWSTEFSHQKRWSHLAWAFVRSTDRTLSQRCISSRVLVPSWLVLQWMVQQLRWPLIRKLQKQRTISSSSCHKLQVNLLTDYFHSLNTSIYSTKLCFF